MTINKVQQINRVGISLQGSELGWNCTHSGALTPILIHLDLEEVTSEIINVWALEDSGHEYSPVFKDTEIMLSSTVIIFPFDSKVSQIFTFLWQ